MNEKMHQTVPSHVTPTASFEPLEQRRMLTTVPEGVFASYADPEAVGGGGSDTALIVGDFNDDGVLDLVDRGTARFGGANGDTANLYATAGSLYSTAAGDVTGDGIDDVIGLADGELLVVTFDGTIASLLPNAAQVGLNADGLRLGDFDGDGDLDAAFGDFAEETVGGNYTFTRHIAFAWNDGNGNFSSPTRLAVDRAVNPASAAVGDLDGDGRDELFLPRYFGGSGFVSALFEVQPNNTMQVRTGEAVTTLRGKLIAFDSDGDGTRDAIAAVRNTGGETQLYRWTLDGNALSRDGGTAVPGDGELASFTAFHDTAAGVPVMVLGHGDGKIAVHAMPAEGGAVARPVATLSVAGAAAELLATDANGDRVPDLVISQPTGTSVATGDAPDISAAPRVDFLVSDRIEQKTETTFTAVSLAGKPNSFSWDFGDGTTATGRTVDHTFATGGQHTVTLVATDSLGRTTTKVGAVRVHNANPKVDVGLPEKVDGTTGRQHILRVSDANADDLAGLRYVIDWHDGTSTTGQVGSDGKLVVDRSFDLAGMQPYTLLVDDGEGGETIVRGEVDVDDAAAAAASDPVRLNGGVLEVYGSNRADTIELLPSGDNDIEVMLNGVSRGTFDARGILIHAGGGDDVVDFSRLSRTHYGTARVMAGTGHDVVRGGAGNDRIFGMRGNDDLDGGDGDDLIEGSAGNDHLVGGRGNDEIVGGRGDNDTVDYSANAADEPVSVVLGGGTSDDGRGGTDRVAGSVEHAVGGAGDDRLSGNRASNYLDGGPGYDILWGGTGGENHLVVEADSVKPTQPVPSAPTPLFDRPSEARLPAILSFDRAPVEREVSASTTIFDRLFGIDLNDDLNQAA